MQKTSLLAICNLALVLTIFTPQIACAQTIATLEGFFTGKTSARGEFSAINGMKRGFDVALSGEWDGRILRLREDFTYDNGQKDTKTWVFTKINETPNLVQYKGTREDVIGETTVNITGNIARFDYLVYLDSANQKMKVHFYDTMILEPNSVINNARITKFALPIARTKVIFTK